MDELDIEFIRAYRLWRCLTKIDFYLRFPEQFGLTDDNQESAEIPVALKQFFQLRESAIEGVQLSDGELMITLLIVEQHARDAWAFMKHSNDLEEVLLLCFETAKSIVNDAGRLIRDKTRAEVNFSRLSKEINKRPRNLKVLSLLNHEWNQEIRDAIAPQATHEVTTLHSGARIAMVDGGIQIDGRVIALKSRQQEILGILVATGGEYVSSSNHGFRSRDIEALPPEVQEIIEAQPGAGTRIRPEWFN